MRCVDASFWSSDRAVCELTKEVSGPQYRPKCPSVVPFTYIPYTCTLKPIAWAYAHYIPFTYAICLIPVPIPTPYMGPLVPRPLILMGDALAGKPFYTARPKILGSFA